MNARNITMTTRIPASIALTHAAESRRLEEARIVSAQQFPWPEGASGDMAEEGRR
jgi:hypothetical protein